VSIHAAAATGFYHMTNSIKAVIALLIVAAILALGGYVYLTRKALSEANARVVAAEQQASLNQQTGEIAERVIRSEVVIRTQAERSADVVKSSSDGETRLSDDFRANLRDERERVRNSTQAGDDQRSPDVAGAVP
jgi:uncharacterized protein HemX